MPSREDEYWAGRKDGLSYCAKHKRYYRSDIGCQLCYLDKDRAIIRSKENIELLKCPACSSISLFWNGKVQLYECINSLCKKSFNEEEVKNGETESQINEPTGDKDSNKNNRKEKCPSCGKETLIWNEKANLYECTNGKCRRRLSRFMKKGLESILKSS